MARLKKDTVSYFPHDADASGGDTLSVLQGRYKNDGYAFYFKLREKLASSNGHFLDLRNTVKWNTFVTKMGVTAETTVEIMVLLVEMGDIDRDLWEHTIIWWQELVDDLAEVYKNRRREIPSKPIITGNNVITTVEKSASNVEISQSSVEIPQSRVEGRGGEESRGEGSSSSSRCTNDVFKNYKENIGELTETIEGEIESAIEEFTAEWVVDAIREAVRQNKRTWVYIVGILNNWKEFGKGSSESKWYAPRRE